MSGARFLREALAELAEQRGLQHEERSGGWIVRVGDGRRHLETYGYQLSLNGGVAAAVARDKAAAAERLEADGVATVPTALVLSDLRQAWRDGRDSRTAFAAAVEQLPPPVVVKPNEGSSGTGVRRADDVASAWGAVSSLLADTPGVVVQPLVPVAREERWVLLGDEPLVRYAKAPAELPLGDGPLRMFNLALGARVTDWGVEAGAAEDLALARRARRSLGLVSAAVDLVTDHGGRTLVMEVNSGWSFEHLVRARPDTRPAAVAAYAAALDAALGRRPLVACP